jgi:uncharacterized protein (TIGR02001 family)
MKKTLIAASLATLSFATVPAQAEAPFSLEGNFSVTSNYVFRGFTQSNSTAAIQGGFDLGHSSGLYIGTWASSIASGSTDGGSLETNLYGGYSFEIGGVGLDVGLLRYYYPKQDFVLSDSKWDTTEAYIGLSYGPVSFKTSRAMTDYFGVDDTKGTLYYDLSGSFPISDSVALNAHYGYSSIKNGSNYKDYKIGISGDIGGYTLAADYISTSPKQEKRAFVVSVSKSF